MSTTTININIATNQEYCSNNSDLGIDDASYKKQTEKITSSKSFQGSPQPYDDKMVNKLQCRKVTALSVFQWKHSSVRITSEDERGWEA